MMIQPVRSSRKLPRMNENSGETREKPATLLNVRLVHVAIHSRLVRRL